MLAAGESGSGSGQFGGGEGGDDDGVVVGAAVALGFFFVGDDGRGGGWWSGCGVGCWKRCRLGRGEERFGSGGGLWFGDRRRARRESGFDGRAWRSGGGPRGWSRGGF